MSKELEKLSALYDGEINEKDFHENLASLDEDPSLKKNFYRFGLISELVQRNSKKRESKVVTLSQYFSKLHPMATNALTAAATVLLTLIVLYQLDDDRFQVDEGSSFQLSSAISSDQAKNQLLNADQNIVEHMIHIMQSNQSHSPQPLSKDWIPVGFSVNPSNPSQYSNGRNNLYFHVENKQLGLKKVKYLKANNNWIYLIPLEDGRLLTAYGDVPPAVANKMIQSIKQRN